MFDLWDKRLSCEQAYTSVVPTLGEVVTDLELVFASAQLAGGSGREIIRECENIFVRNVCKSVRHVSRAKPTLEN